MNYAYWANELEKENKVRIRWLVYFCAALFFLLISTSLHAAQKLEANKSYFDFGSITEGMNIPVSFTITNTGSDDAVIREIRTFAACVESRPLAKRSLKPGESIELEYIFQSLGYGGVTVDKHIEVHYNNTAFSPLKLAIRGRVLPLESYQAPIGELTYNFFVLIDIRPPERFVKEHIMGAVNVPYEMIDKWESLVSKNISEEVIIYLFSEDGSKSDKAAKSLGKKGHAKYLSIVGGMKEWKRQNGNKFLISGKQ